MIGKDLHATKDDPLNIWIDFMNHSIRHSIIAGFIATLILSIFMIMKKIMGVMPQMNPIGDLVLVMEDLTGLSVMPIFAWLLHFFIGTVIWGVAFALIYAKLPGGRIIKGIVFGISAWLLMMLTVEPLAGHGIFGVHTSIAIPMMSLILHIIYGAILGIVYSILSKRPEQLV